MKSKTGKIVIDNFLILLFPLVMIFLVGPFEIYAGNEAEFIFGAKDFFWNFCLVVVVFLIIGTTILTAINLKSEKASLVISSLIFTFSCLFYIQNMFMNSRIFNVDGSKVDWESIKPDIISNTVIWIGLIIIFMDLLLTTKKDSKRIMVVVSSFITVTLLITVISLLFSTEYNSDLSNQFVLTADEQYTVGAEDNVIVLILDKYGNEKFNKLYNEDEHFADVLKDFTYYNNMNSRFNYTSISIAYTFTDHEDTVENINANDHRYTIGAWESDDCVKRYDAIHNAGYITSYYSSKGFDHICGEGRVLEGKIDNCVRSPIVVDKGLIFRLLTKMSIYKYAPTALKKPFEVMTYSFESSISYAEAREADYRNGDFYASLCEDGLIKDNDKTKRLIIEHIEGTHEFAIDENGNTVEDMSFEDGFEITQKGLMVILNKYFDELKRLDLYDSSTIIVMSDHGLQLDKVDPQPIFFIKPANQIQDKMTVNSAPISSEDIMPTIIDAMGVDSSAFGKTVFQWNSGDVRERSCAYPENGYVPYVYTGDGETLRMVMRQ